MAEPLSPDHVFGFPSDDLALDIEDDPELDIEEDPEEDPKMDIDDDQEMDIRLVVASPVGLPPLTPPPLPETLFDFDFVAPVTTDSTLWVPPSGSTFEIGGLSSVTPTLPHLLEHELRRLRQDTEALHGSVRTLTRGMKTRRTEIATARTRLIEYEALQAHAETAEASATLAAMDRDKIEMDLYIMRVWISMIQLEMFGREVMEARPTESIDVLAVYGDARPSRSQGPPDDYEANRANAAGAEGVGLAGARGARPAGAGGAEPAGGNAGGNFTPEVCGCSYKTFLNCNPHTFNGTKRAVGLSRWFEKLESVFQVRKCSDEDRVKFSTCTLEGRALT
ncbi:hypothetical protein Tco_0492698 [Tanacetum coccineum]